MNDMYGLLIILGLLLILSQCANNERVLAGKRWKVWQTLILTLILILMIIKVKHLAQRKNNN